MKRFGMTLTTLLFLKTLAFSQDISIDLNNNNKPERVGLKPEFGYTIIQILELDSVRYSFPTTHQFKDFKPGTYKIKNESSILEVPAIKAYTTETSGRAFYFDPNLKSYMSADFKD